MPLSGWSDRADVASSVELREARTLRPGSSVAVGIAAVAIGLVFIVSALLGAERNWALVGTTTLGVVLLWLFIVRPCVVIHAEGVRIVNPLRTLDITWPMIDEVRSRWALEVVVQGRRCTAWGVPAETARPRGRELLRRTTGQRRPDEATAADYGRRPKVVARVVAAEIEERVAADRQRAEGTTPRIAASTWEPVPLALLGAAIAFWAVCMFLP